MDLADTYITFVRQNQDILRDRVSDEMYTEKIFDVSSCQSQIFRQRIITSRHHVYNKPEDQLKSSRITSNKDFKWMNVPASLSIPFFISILFQSRPCRAVAIVKPEQREVKRGGESFCSKRPHQEHSSAHCDHFQCLSTHPGLLLTCLLSNNIERERARRHKRVRLAP